MQTPGDLLRRAGRRLLHSRWVFDLGAWPYDVMTANPIWRASCARLLDSVSPGGSHVTVLDLGIGPGVSAFAMGRRHRDATFIGVDVVQRMLELAAANRSREGWPPERLALLRADALHLPLAEATVDVVVGHSFLYLLSDHEATLTEAFRVLRSGGQVAFLEPNAAEVDWGWLWQQGSVRLLTSLSLWRFYNWFHRRFSAEQLTLALQQAGFTQVSTEVTLGGFGIFGRARKP